MHAKSSKTRVSLEVDLKSLEDFKVSAPSMVIALLAGLVEQRTILTVYKDLDNPTFVTGYPVHCDDSFIDLDISRDDAAQWDWLDKRRGVIVGFLQGIKLQFHPEVQMIRRENAAWFLRCSLPDFVYRIQRRGAYRVLSPLEQAPELVLRSSPGCETAYSVLDLSATGLAFELRPEATQVQVGDSFEHARLELGWRVPIPCSLAVRSVSAVQVEPCQGVIVRVGAEFVNLPAAIARDIQMYVYEAERAALRITACAQNDID